MKISVVIAAYNAAGLLGETLASVAAQTQPADEVIVVDDGSSDDTAIVAASFGVRVISTTNRGVSAARNTGIAEASGDWIALLDADDLWDPAKLARQAAAVTLAPDAGIVTCDHYQFRGAGEITRASVLGERHERYAALRPQRLAPGVSRLDNMGTRIVSIGMAFFPSTLMVRRDIALRVGGFDESMRRCEDYEFLMRALAICDLVVVEEPPLMGYRVHGASLSNDAEAMNAGLVVIADRLAEHPEHYATGASTAFASRERDALVENAVFHIKRGDGARARGLLMRAGRIRRDARWVALLGASWLPRGSMAVISSLVRRVSHPS